MPPTPADRPESGLPGRRARVSACAAVVTTDGAVLQVDDPAAELDGVHLEPGWSAADPTPEFVFSGGRWVLRLPRPPAWRLEYRTVLRHHDGTRSTLDAPTELHFPDYRSPAWLDTPDTGTLRAVPTPAGRLAAPVPTRLWSPAGLSSSAPAPLLVVHDGSDLAERGALLRWAAHLYRPIRVALLDAAPGHREEWYAADPDYADHLAEVVLPAIGARVLTGSVVGLGASLGAVALLATQRQHPASFSALALQSGSFFTPDLDPQESDFRFFGQITAFVRRTAAGPDLSRAAPRPVPVLLTCGAVEENLANNRAMAAVLTRQGHPVDLRIVPDAHSVVGWRDAWSPGLENLLQKVDR
ncbi:hypothetical protein JL107_06290 [Nakamurella flavida]|uniref:Esterase n=1 Tax=Nakamurella flavida TaxID=363630 RepID=A0A938YHK2_9ACTN|nr:hypothetical protein [Nakamurella flavida]MBM9476047.1 hypothetical protein [Nakamurella flavida]MDP9777210.1 enterochelin esterase family protein [Nakamurella flavida]